MVIQLTEDLAIERDQYCWAICKRVKKKHYPGGWRWEQFRWYPHLHEAVSEALELTLPDTAVTTLAELENVLAGLGRRISKQIDAQFGVNS